MVGRRIGLNVYHFDCTDLADALCAAAGTDLSREVMTKSRMRQAIADVKKPWG